MDAFELQEKLDALDIEQAVNTAASSSAFLSEVVDQNRDQWELGENSKGEKIGEYHSPEYAQMKFEENSRAGRGNVDLMLTHDLEKNMFAKSEGDGSITIDSGDWKSNMLQQRYGSEIFGINDDHKEDCVFVLQNELNKQVNEQVQL